MKHQLLTLISALALTAISHASLDGLQIIKLWPEDKAPTGDDSFENSDARLHIHRLPEATANGATVIVCPGGGYGGLVMGGEGHGIAKWLNSHGITAAVLQYRLPKGRHQVPLLDAQRAIRIVRTNAKEWGVAPDKIGIIGFSAGGHLASTAATHFDKGDPSSEDPIEKASSRPDFAILVYPVVTMGEGTHGGSRQRLLGKAPSPGLIKNYSAEQQVTKDTPPIYLTHALDDKVVIPANSKNLHQALQAKGIESEYLELPSGGHGLNGYKGPMWDAWQKGSLEWLTRIGVTPG